VGPTVTWSSDKQTMDWILISEATGFNVYRGTIPQTGGMVYDHVCFENGSLDTSTTDIETPTTGGFYYLVNGENCFGESSLGSKTGGPVRPNTSPCP